MTQDVEAGDEVAELAKEIRRLIESNKQFLEKVYDEDYDDDESDEDSEDESEDESEDIEEL